MGFPRSRCLFWCTFRRVLRCDDEPRDRRKDKHPGNIPLLSPSGLCARLLVCYVFGMNFLLFSRLADRLLKLEDLTVYDFIYSRFSAIRKNAVSA